MEGKSLLIARENIISHLQGSVMQLDVVGSVARHRANSRKVESRTTIRALTNGRGIETCERKLILSLEVGISIGLMYCSLLNRYYLPPPHPPPG